MDIELDSLFKSTKSSATLKPATNASSDHSAFIERLQEAQKAATEHLEAQTFASQEKLKNKLMAERRIEQAKLKEKKDTSATKAAPQPIDPEINKRTLFVGNLPVVCIQKAEYKQLKRHFSRHGKIRSIRFRSIAFKNALPRKMAFISGKLHPDRDSLNAYIVFEDESSVAAALVENGTVFMNKHLRLDTCDESKSHNKKRSIFVGNLPFSVKEEDLWVLFGPCGGVVNVRVVRDKQTNVGKGFAYVEFTETDSVAAALRMHGTLFEKRELRVFKYHGKASQEKEAKKTESAKGPAKMNKVQDGGRQAKAKPKHDSLKRERQQIKQKGSRPASKKTIGSRKPLKPRDSRGKSSLTGSSRHTAKRPREDL